MKHVNTIVLLAVVGSIGLPIVAGSGISAAKQNLSGGIKTRRVSLSFDGSEVGRGSEFPLVSRDGRFVAFASRSSKLVPGDDNKATDVFIRDRLEKTTEIVSVASNGEPGNSHSFPNDVSPDGRFVVFSSVASNLAEDDVDPELEEALDVFIHDRETGVTERVSVNSNGERSLAPSFSGAVSDDGRFVVFESGGWNLSDIDHDQTFDVFVRDRDLGTTELVSVNSNGEAGNFSSGDPSISGDGRFVVFDSGADNYVAGDSNEAYDSFVHDRLAGTTEIVSVDSNGAVGRWGGVSPEITPDGRFVLFSSQSRLVPRDTNKKEDAYLHNVVTGRTTLVSRTWRGRQGNGNSSPSGISDDGRYLSFVSGASNLVPNDTNGEWDYFRFDRVTKTTVRVNVNSRGKQAKGDKGFNHSSRISGDGRFVVFESSASNLVANDRNNSYDVFIRGPFPQ
jgi:hypothetical protein